MTFVPLQEFFPGTLRRPTPFFFFMEGSATGILLEDARLSKLMVVQSLVYSDFITKVGFGHNFTTLTCLSRQKIYHHPQLSANSSRFSPPDSTPWPSQVK